MTRDETTTRWFYLCPEDELARPNAFAATRIGAVPVVVQNLGGRLGAFRNVCTHRFAVIQGEAAGCRPLRCPYHGWTFDAAGIPVGIPFNRTDFGLDDEGRRKLALHPAAVDRCGPFLFVRVDPDHGPPLADQLGARFADLAALGRAYPRPVALPAAAAAPGEPEAGFAAACAALGLAAADPGWRRGTVGINLCFAVLPATALVVVALAPPGERGGADGRFVRLAAFRPAAAAETP